MKSFRLILRSLALFLAFLLLGLSTIACANKQGDPLLTLDLEGQKATFSVNHYWFMLSRFKGDLVTRGITNGGGSAETSAFWEMQGYFEGNTLKTWDSYYREQVLENCKTYLVGLWLFEKNGLKISETATANIQQQLDDLLTYYGNGSKTKLNSILSQYGVNYTLLKSFYETEAKLGTVQNFLYGVNASKLDSSVKDPYLNEHYFRYKRIFLSFESGAKDDVRAEAEELLLRLQAAPDEEFESVMVEKNGTDEYTDGYYIPRGATVGNTAEQVAFFVQIGEQLEGMEIGETALVETADGIQILRRYQPTPGAYDLDENTVWFSSFAGNLMDELFLKECESYFPEIVLNEDAFAAAPKIQDIAPNYSF